MAAYFAFFHTAAVSEAEPVREDVDARYGVARESTTVAFHVRHRPFCQGTRVRQSERFPSSLSNPTGSFVTGTSDYLSARQNEINVLVVAKRSASAYLTRYAVCASGAHCCATRTNVRFTGVKSETQPECDTSGLVAHTKTA